MRSFSIWVWKLGEIIIQVGDIGVELTYRIVDITADANGVFKEGRHFIQ